MTHTVLHMFLWLHPLKMKGHIGEYKDPNKHFSSPLFRSLESRRPEEIFADRVQIFGSSERKVRGGHLLRLVPLLHGLRQIIYLAGVAVGSA